MFIILLICLTPNLKAAPSLGTTTFDNPAAGGFASANGTAPQSASYLGYTFTVAASGNAQVTHAISRINLAAVSGELSYFEIGSSDGSEFQLDAIAFRVNTDTFVGAWTITGYRDGNPVSGATSAINVVATNLNFFFLTGSIAAFDNVDAVRLTGPTNAGTAAVYAIMISAPVVPTVVNSVSSTASDGLYAAGVIPIQVNFSGNVFVTGTPQLMLNTGRAATYASGSGTPTLTFSYAIQPGDESPDLDYASTTALTLNGGTILDGTNQPAILTLPNPGMPNSLAGNKNLTIDAPPNTAPILGNLNADSVAWAGVGAFVSLDSGGNALVSDAENDTGNWDGGTLTVQRIGTAWAADVFGFNPVEFSVDGTSLNSADMTFGTFSNSGGTLSITFNGNANSSLVQAVVRSITYRNDTPAGNATIRFVLSDGEMSAEAGVTVTSSLIYVTQPSDKTLFNLADGVSFSEAVGIANSNLGAQTLILSSAFNYTTVNLASIVFISDDLTLNSEAAEYVRFSGHSITLVPGRSFTVGSSSQYAQVAIESTLAGGGTLIKQGKSKLSLRSTSNEASMSGSIIVYDGNLDITDDNQLPSGSIVLSGGTLSVGVDGVVIDNNIELGPAGGIFDIFGGGGSHVITVSGTITGPGSLTKEAMAVLVLSGNNTYMGGTIVKWGTLRVSGPSNLGTGALTLGNGTLDSGAGGTVISVPITLTGNATIANAGPLILSGAISGGYGFTKVGAGQLTLSGVNTYTGATTVGDGTLSLQGGAAIHDFAAVVLVGGTALELGASETVGELAGLGLVNLGAHTLTVGGSGTSSTFAGPIQGTGGITKVGAGTLTLTGMNTYGGATLISAGTIRLEGGGSLGIDSAVTVSTGAALSTTGPVSVGSLAGAGTVSLGGSMTVGYNHASTTFSGTLSGIGPLQKTGSGILTLSGANSSTFNGLMVILSGGISVASADNLTTGPLHIFPGTIIDVTASTTITNSILLLGSATFQTAGGTGVTLAGGAGGLGGISKSGAGALMLSGTNTYFGPTTVSAGTLILDGVLNTAGVTVNTGATLAGSGSITAGSELTVSNGGILTPGISGPGVLTINGGLTLSPGAIFSVDLNGAAAGTGYDQVIVSGLVKVNGANLAATLGYVPAYNDAYMIINNTGSTAISGTFFELEEGGTRSLGGVTFTAAYMGGTGDDFVLMAPVNKAPSFVTPPAISLVDTAAADVFANQTGTLSATDAEHDPVTYGISGGEPGANLIGGINYNVSKAGTYGTLHLASGTGQFVYVPNAAAINALVSSTNEVFTFTASDGNQESSAALTINLTGANDAPLNSVVPMISGSAKVASMLGASKGTWSDAEGHPLTYSYQWYRANDSTGTGEGAIGGATNSTYAVTSIDAHKHLRVAVTANDNHTTQTASSTRIEIENSAPVNIVPPVISGTATVGSKLKTSNGVWSDADGDGRTFSYQWYRANDSTGTGETAIASATASSYTLTSADAHKYVRVVVTANDGRGGDQSASSSRVAIANSAPVNSAIPTISGTATVGNTVTASTGTWTDADGDALTYTYQWYRANDGTTIVETVIAGATSSSYTLTSEDAHKYLRVAVTANDGHGSNDAEASSIRIAIANSAPVNSVPPAISGTALVGSTLTTTTGTWTDADGDGRTFSYQWYRADDSAGTGETAIASATASSYTLTTADAHKYVRVIVTANDGHTTQTAGSSRIAIGNSAPVNSFPPAISGMALVGQALTTSNGTWTDADGDGRTFTYEWRRAKDSVGTGEVTIIGATSSSYTLTTADAHKFLRVIVTANDGHATQTASSVRVAIANTGPVASVAPAISGFAFVGNTLTGSNGTWTDADGDVLSYTYQWYRANDNAGTGEVAITAATNSSYTLTIADAHKYLRVTVTAHDGRTTQATSSSRVAVNDSSPVNTVAPAISGLPVVGNTLTGNNGTWTDADGDTLTFTYQWYRANDSTGNGAVLTHTTSTNYVLTAADAHKYLRMTVTAKDGYTSQGAASEWIKIGNSAPVNTLPPAISGMALVGQALTTSNGTWTDADGDGRTFTYEWRRAKDSVGTGEVTITAATNSSYTLTIADAHKFLRVIVTANDGHATQTASSVRVAIANTGPVASVAPAISGFAFVGRQLAVSNGTWTDADGDVLSYTYQWYRANDNAGTGEVAIQDATSSSYTLTIADAHKHVRVIVTAHDGRTTQATSSSRVAVNDSSPVNTVAPAISGLPVVGNTLTGNNGTWTDADGDTLTFTYQWYRANDSTGNGAVLTHTTSTNYVLTAADAHKYLRMTVTAKDGYTSQGAASEWIKIGNSAPVNTLPPAISGMALVGSTLTTTTGTWTDKEGDNPTYSYQWYRDDDNTGTGEVTIIGATSSSYTLTTADAHKHVRVIVTANDGQTNETASSSRVAIANTAPVNSVPPAISGTVTVGKTVTASTGTWADADGDGRSYNYQWYRASDSTGTAETAITSATGSSYTVTTADAHKFLRVVVTANDGHGSDDQTASSGRIAVNNTAPTVDGAASNQPVNDIETIAPFSAIIFSDIDLDSVSVTVALDDPDKGIFTPDSLQAAGFVDSGGGIYQLTSSSASAASAAIRALVFAPTDNRVAVGSTETTTFAIVANDSRDATTNLVTTVISTSINQSPSFSADTILPAVDEDSSNPPGATVATLFGALFVDTADISFEGTSTSLAGVAVAADQSAAAQGRWQYSIDDGTHWIDLGTVTTNEALLLSSSTKLRFLPALNYNGPVGALVAYAVDNSVATTFTTSTRAFADVSSHVSSSSISAAGVTLATTITPANDAPYATTSIADQSGIYGESFSYTAPLELFADVDAGDVLTWSATGLPTGITFDSAARSFTGVLEVPGQYTVTLTVTDSGNLQASTSFTISVSKAVLTITAENKSKVYGASIPALTVRYSGFIGNEGPSDLDSLPVASTAATHESAVGSYAITASGAASTKYAITYVPGTLTITKATLIAKADDKTKAFGSANPHLTISFTGWLNADSAADLDVAPTASTKAQIASPVGSYPIVVSGGLDNNYQIVPADGTLTIQRATLTVTAEDKSREYGAANPVLTMTFSGFQNGDTINVLDSMPSLHTEANETSPAGTYEIKVTGGSASNYELVRAPGILTVTKAALQVRADDKTKAYGAANPQLTMTYSGWRNGDSIAVLDSLPVASTTTDAATAPGQYPITVSGGSDNNYHLVFQPGTLTVGKALLQAKANDVVRSFGSSDPALTIAYSGFVNGDSPATLDVAPVAHTGATASSGVGQYPITVGGGSDDRYDFVYQEGTLTITKAVLLAKADDLIKLQGAANPALTVTYTGFVNGDTVAVLDQPPVAQTTATTSSPAGTYPITLSGGLDENYSLNLTGGSLEVILGDITMRPATNLVHMARCESRVHILTGAAFETGGRTNLSGAALTIVISENGSPEDVLTVDLSALSREPGHTGSYLLTSGDTAFGLLSGGTNGQPFVVKFQTGAVEEHLRGLLEALVFETTSPSAAIRELTITLTGITGGESSFVVSVSVQHCPTVGIDRLVVSQNTSRDVAFGDLLNRVMAQSADTNVIEFAGLTARFGAVQFIENGIRYTPPAGFAGKDTINYVVYENNQLTAKGRINVHVLAIGELVAFDIGKTNPGSEAKIQLSSAGTPGQVVRILASSDLLTWQFIGTAIISPDGVLEFLDGDARLKDFRFYRTVSDTQP